MARTNSLPSKRRASTSSDNAPAAILPLGLAIIQNIVLSPSTEGDQDAGASMGDKVQRAYSGQISASTHSGNLEASFPEIHITSSDFNTDSEVTRLLAEFDNSATCSALEAGATVSEATVTNANDQGSEWGGSLILSQLSIPDILTPFSGYDSNDNFEPVAKKFKGASLSTPSSSLKGGAKAKTSKIGVGSFGKGTLLKKSSKSVESMTKPSTSTSFRNAQIKHPNPENEDCSILRKILTAQQALPTNKCNSDPENAVGCTKKEVKSCAAISLKSADNTARNSECLNAVLPASDVRCAPVVHVIDSIVEPAPEVEHPIDSDSELEVLFSQEADRLLLRNYNSMHRTFEREHAANLANIQISRSAFARADEANRRTEEAYRLSQQVRRLALAELEKHQKALDKSTKQLRKFK